MSDAFFKAIADANRRKILSLLKKKQFIHYSLNTTILEDVLGWFKEITARNEEKTK